jgi:uncharacterized DUF497 family protein
MDLRNALIDWDDPDDEMGNTRHIAEHGLTTDEVESVLYSQDTPDTQASGSSGRPIAFGMTNTGRYIAVIFEILNPADPQVVYPVTAFEVTEPKM